MGDNSFLIKNLQGIKIISFLPCCEIEFGPFLPPFIKKEEINLDYFPAVHFLGKK